MRRLFDERDHWTDEARELSVRVSTAIRPLVSEAMASGVSIRDVELVIMHDVSMLCAELKVRSDIKLRKAAKGQP